MEDKSSRHYQDRQECVILGTTHAYPAQVIQHTLWRMASAAKHVKHPPKHIRNHMQHIYKGLHKHANITLTCLRDCMSLYTYFRNHSSTTGTWPNFWQSVFNFWQLTHQGDCAPWGASRNALVPGRTPAAAAEFVAGPWRRQRLDARSMTTGAARATWKFSSEEPRLDRMEQNTSATT